MSKISIVGVEGSGKCHATLCSILVGIVVDMV